MTLGPVLDGAVSLASERERDGDLRGAAELRALLGVSKFVENGGQYDHERATGSGRRKFRYGIAWLLYAVSLYERAGDHRHAAYAATLVDPMIDRMEGSAEERHWVGVASEWRGDLRLMVGDGDPLEPYETARSVYEEAGIGLRDAGPAFDASMDGYLDFVRRRGIEPPYGEGAGRLVVRNHERIDWKIDVAGRLDDEG